VLKITPPIPRVATAAVAYRGAKLRILKCTRHKLERLHRLTIRCRVISIELD